MYFTFIIAKYKSWVLNIIVIILALIIANGILKIQTKDITLLKQRKDEATKKIEALGGISQLQRNINAYKKIINNKDISSVINTLGNIAQEARVELISLKPQAEQSSIHYVSYPFRLAIQASNYHTLGKFISKLENSADIYMIDYISISKQETAEFSKLSVDLQLSTLLIKD